METTCVKEYRACDPPRHGCSDRVISKSPQEYLLLKKSRPGENFAVVGLTNQMKLRYGTRTTPTTRRTDYDIERRRYY